MRSRCRSSLKGHLTGKLIARESPEQVLDAASLGGATCWFGRLHGLSAGPEITAPRDEMGVSRNHRVQSTWSWGYPAEEEMVGPRAAGTVAIVA